MAIPMAIKRFSPLRPSLGKPGLLTPLPRLFHQVRGEFISRQTGNQKLVTQVVPIVLGEPDEAYVMVPPATGQAMQAVYINEKPRGHNLTMDRIPLVFHHKTRHFALPDSLYPRLVVPQDLRGLSDGPDTSTATLWLFGATHSIALDETVDAEFIHESYKSHLSLEKISRNLKTR
ncbi:hypothetical protein F5Y14DRAFT_156868 [Nemania sp. NC0429]|nr:hypothetical protein F5Y14DRAFT_156868 [Nemania sp. NC0429]